MSKPKDDLETLLNKHSLRKVEQISEITFEAFRLAAEEYGTLSADEIFAIGVSVLMSIAIKPLERMTDNKKELRRQLGWQIVRMIKQDSDDAVN